MELSAREVFEILVGQHAPMLRAYVFSAVRRTEDANDLVQETLVAAWKSLPTYDRAKPFAPWLRGIAFHVISDWRRSQARRAVLLCDEPTLELIGRRFERFDRIEGDTWNEKTGALRACLDELESEDRQIIDLRYERGLECGAIATSLERGLEWVKKRLQRARARLAMCVDGKLSVEES